MIRATQAGSPHLFFAGYLWFYQSRVIVPRDSAVIQNIKQVSTSMSGLAFRGSNPFSISCLEADISQFTRKMPEILLMFIMTLMARSYLILGQFEPDKQ